ncbi:MAG TPA: class II aldolase/adducin family protein [Pseudonocardiaceae bacterium]|jgi:ribulose-5-phosphate 4-epimerase/fuculose-1-phosphate aldolase|nr:class II aldolase/adducin family protein [Pseudonocardiaceae bacterium]
MAVRSAPTTDVDHETELREAVAAAGAVLHKVGLVDYLGHCSARLPGTDRVVIKPKHSPVTRSPERLHPDQMVVIDLDGNLVAGNEKPPAERFIHTEIYRARPDVHAVVHTHQRAATLLGVIGGDLLPVLHVPAVLTNGGRMNTWPVPELVTTADLGRQLADALGDASLCHLQGHGIVSVATDVPRATVTAIALEQLADANLTILQTGRTPRVISDAELGSLRGTVANVDGRWAYYRQLVEEEHA